MVIQDVSQKNEVNTEIFPTHAPHGEPKLSLCAIPRLVDNEPRPECAYSVFEDPNRLFIHLSQLLEEIKGGPDPLLIVAVHSLLDHLLHLRTGSHCHPAVEEGPPDKLVGVFQRGRLRGDQEDPGVGDKEEVEDMGGHTRSQIKDDVIGIQGLDLADDLLLLALFGIAERQDIVDTADYPQVGYAGLRDYPLDVPHTPPDEVVEAHRRSGYPQEGMKVCTPEVGIDHNHLFSPFAQGNPQVGSHKTLADPPLAAGDGPDMLFLFYLIHRSLLAATATPLRSKCRSEGTFLLLYYFLLSGSHSA